MADSNFERDIKPVKILVVKLDILNDKVPSKQVKGQIIFINPFNKLAKIIINNLLYNTFQHQNNYI